jgi:hypothetical protein
MPEHERIAALEKRLRDIELWQAGHGGQEEERWTQQHAHNDRVDTITHELRDAISVLTNRITRMETKVAILTAIAGAVGAGLGTVISQLILQ